MKIESIGYVGFHAPDLGAWRRFARELMAAQTVDAQSPDGADALRLRLDEKCQRMLITQSPEPGGAYFGLEVEDERALALAERQFADAGVATQRGSEREAAFRGVDALLRLRDPVGHVLELYHGLARAEQAFVPPRLMGGFCTGALGFGHAVLVASEFDRCKDFYCGLLGFRVSDFLSVPNRRVFLHINPRHHSLALAERSGSGIAHLMVEVNEFDDLGRAYDIAQRDYAGAITSTLGRHSNDFMTSFYVRTPSGFPLEYGWGGRLVGADWQAEELFGPSLWGHDRRADSATSRQAADRQRQYAFEHGIRAPGPARPTTPGLAGEH